MNKIGFNTILEIIERDIQYLEDKGVNVDLIKKKVTIIWAVSHCTGY